MRHACRRCPGALDIGRQSRAGPFSQTLAPNRLPCRLWLSSLGLVSAPSALAAIYVAPGPLTLALASSPKASKGRSGDGEAKGWLVAVRPSHPRRPGPPDRPLPRRRAAPAAFGHRNDGKRGDRTTIRTPPVPLCCCRYSSFRSLSFAGGGSPSLSFSSSGTVILTGSEAGPRPASFSARMR